MSCELIPENYVPETLIMYVRPREANFLVRETCKDRGVNVTISRNKVMILLQPARELRAKERKKRRGDEMKAVFLSDKRKSSST